MPAFKHNYATATTRCGAGVLTTSLSLYVRVCGCVCVCSVVECQGCCWLPAKGVVACGSCPHTFTTTIPPLPF